jgi:hypothetical protein
MLAHENSGVRVVNQVACEMWQLQEDLFGDFRMSLGRRSIMRLGEARSALTNRQAAGALHGRRMTRGCVVTRRNSYSIAQLVYQASGRARWRSSQCRQGA